MQPAKIYPRSRSSRAAGQRHASVTSLARAALAEHRNLPLPPTPLIGRERELEAIVAGLSTPGVRLITLTGTGGVGKTRLAIAAAEMAQVSFADGVRFADLSRIREPGLVGVLVGRAIGVPQAGRRRLLESIERWLERRELLLVLDNFEHLLSAAGVVGDLLERCAGLKVLTTSRAPLRLRWEHDQPVEPLAVPVRGSVNREHIAQSPAVQLFVKRAQAAQPGFTPAAPDSPAGEALPAVAELCRRLDGLPLAIELAAARSRVLAPSAQLARLNSCLDLLAHGLRDAPERHRTLRASIAWSEDLLAEDERIVFRKLGVWVGGCTQPAAQFVAPGATLDCLTSLLEKGLLRLTQQADGEPRWSMLETIREYALEQLDVAGGADTARRDQANWCLALAEGTAQRLPDADQAAWADQLEREHGNMAAALDWAIETGDTDLGMRLASVLGKFWLLRGHLDEGWRRLHQALTRCSDTSSARAGALYGAGRIATELGLFSDANQLHEEGLALARTVHDQAAIGGRSRGAMVGVSSRRSRSRASKSTRRAGMDTYEVDLAYAEPDGFALTVPVLLGGQP